jgi:hypothetical protein
MLPRTYIVINGNAYWVVAGTLYSAPVLAKGLIGWEESYYVDFTRIDAPSRAIAEEALALLNRIVVDLDGSSGVD